MFEFWNRLDMLHKVLIVIAILVVVIVIIVLVVVAHKRSETFITALNPSRLDDTATEDPLQHYVNSWIASVKNLYQTKSVVSQEGYVDSRSVKKFDNLLHLRKDPIITGSKRY